MLIYKITNTINGKLYIGQTIRTLEERKQQHLNSINTLNTGKCDYGRGSLKVVVDNLKWFNK